MRKELGLSEVRGQLSQIVNGVLYDRDIYIISKQGKPAAAIVPLDVLEQWQAERDRLFEVMDEVHEQNQDMDPDELKKAFPDPIGSFYFTDYAASYLSSITTKSREEDDE